MVAIAEEQPSRATPIPPAPPPPTQRVPIATSKSVDQSKLPDRVSNLFSGSIQNPNDHVPSALASAFNQPDKNKKPFTYFQGGVAPEIISSGRTTPSAVKRSSAGTPTNGPIIPKYNSPLNLYSPNNVQTAYQQQTAGIQPGFGSRPEWNPAQSETYKALLAAQDDDTHGGRPLTPHSAVMEEPSKNDTVPHYHGFVNPYQQSPSFKRLQNYTGSADYIEQNVPRSFENNPGQENIDPSLAVKLAEAERPKTFQPVVPQWAHKANQKRAKWEQYGDYDPRGQAERRYVEPDPHWAEQAKRNQDKWQSHYSQYHYETGSTGGANRSAGPPPPSFNRGYEMGGQDYNRQTQRRARSVEPPNWRRNTSSWQTQQEKKEPWMKPYIAPNVIGWRAEAPSAGSIISNQHISNSRNQYSTAPFSFGTYYGPPDGFKSGHRHGENRSAYYPDHEFCVDFSRSSRGRSVPRIIETAAPSQQQHYTQSSSQYTRGSSPVWRNAPQPQQQYSSGQSQQQHYSSSQSHNQTQPMWQHEQEAWQQKQQMEREVLSRQQQSSASTTYATSPRPTSESRAAVQQYRPPTSQSQTSQWNVSGPDYYATAGANTKASTSGSYIDGEGNKVQYTKELYTSNDPGKEFNMLTEQERKVMEEPMQPGVISRHVTTKYYKKSTFSNSSTTSAAQPVTGVQRPLAIQGPISTGEVKPGMTQF